jgi:predicted O-methyltransferase YrrM
LRLKETTGEKVTMMHGRIAHGSQFTDEGRKELPTAYYGPESGAGLVLRLHRQDRERDPAKPSLKAGIIGLGAGTLAAYGQKGDRFRFYEINPAVTAVSERFFSFCRNSKGSVEVIHGDARIMLEAELARKEPQHFDILVVDAFSSDAIPIHLLTRECFELYRKHLKPDGLLLFHITNRFLDLAPVVRGHAQNAGMEIVRVNSSADSDKGIWKADWMVMGSNAACSALRKSVRETGASGGNSLVWTDDFAALWQVIKR